jgi:uncharacterized protein (TIGR01777 family)
MIGSAITELLLLAQKHQVGHLGRGLPKNNKVKGFLWNPSNYTIDPKALEWADAIIHLAGENIGSEAWTPKRKKDIIDSRINAARTLKEGLTQMGKQPKAIICASAIGYYGNTGNRVVDETALPGTGFQSEVTRVWEKALFELKPLTQRQVVFRIGIVLSERGGALPKMIPAARMGITALGDGKQWMSVIELKDLAKLFVEALENPTREGIYNAVDSHPVTNKEYMVGLTKKYGLGPIFPGPPAWLLKVILGEMSELVLGSIRVISSRK